MFEGRNFFRIRARSETQPQEVLAGEKLRGEVERILSGRNAPREKPPSTFKIPSDSDPDLAGSSFESRACANGACVGGHYLSKATCLQPHLFSTALLV